MEGSSGIGYIDGSVDATTQRFDVVLDENAVVELDDLIVCRQELPQGIGTLTHYGIVVEGLSKIEGAQIPSDTQRIYGTRTMPGQRMRKVTVQILRTHPERWLPPQPGARAELARGNDRAMALFQDRMEGNRLALGLDHLDQPVYVDWNFVNGEKGGHLSISGISGVATKTSFALFALYMLMETPEGRRLLGHHVGQTTAVVFNVKGEDLLHIDRPNRKFAGDARAQEMWAALGVSEPRPFKSVGIFVPPGRSGGPVLAARVAHRRDDEYTIYGWTPLDFIRRGLLQFVFGDTRENQVAFLVEHIRSVLVRHAVPSAHTPGAVIIRSQPVAHRGRDFEQASDELRRAGAEQAQDDPEIKNFSDLVDLLVDRIENNDQAYVSARMQSNTNEAFLRRLLAMSRRLGHLVTHLARPLALDRNVNVVDIHTLHDDAQRFVVGALLDQVWQEKQTGGREPLRFVLLDELNKYAPREGHSPIKEMLVDIASRGRSLGVILVGCQQNAARVERAIVDNASIKVVGRLDASHADEYKFLSGELRDRATRFLPGTMVLDQPVVPAPIPIVFPFPPYATNVSEDPIGAAALRDVKDPVDRLAP